MKSKYKQRIAEHTEKARALELEAAKQYSEGDQGEALRLCRLADMELKNVKILKIQLESL